MENPSRMWIQTRDRAISITLLPPEYRGEEGYDLQVRGRLRSDVEGLVNNRRIIRTPKADYRYRILVRWSELTTILMDLSARVNYTNFKNAVSDRYTDRSPRYRAYARIHHLIEEELSEPVPREKTSLFDLELAEHELRYSIGRCFPRKSLPDSVDRKLAVRKRKRPNRKPKK